MCSIEIRYEIMHLIMFCNCFDSQTIYIWKIETLGSNLVMYLYVWSVYGELQTKVLLFEPFLSKSYCHFPGTELLVWYGDEYARELGLVRDKNLLFRPQYVNNEGKSKLRLSVSGSVESVCLRPPEHRLGVKRGKNQKYPKNSVIKH